VDWDGKPLFKGHTATTLDVRWTVQETEVSRLLTEYILKSIDFARTSDRGTQLVVQLVMHTFHKLAASSWPALERALQRRLDTLHGRVEKLSELLEGDDDEEQNEEVRDFVLPAQAFFENERALLNTLLSQLRNLPADSKWHSCSELLTDLERTEPGAKVLIFTQYRTTQEMLKDRVPKMFPGVIVEVINGDVEMEDRRAARIRFERGSRFMVSTEAGGEGINLQKACHLMVNYDLPWNPMRLQQRIGRLDRYGQKQVVHVFNLRVPDSWDQHISTRIMERLEVIQKTMAAAGPGNIEDYREMILGQVAEHVDATSLFAAARAGKNVTDNEMDAWITMEQVLQHYGLLEKFKRGTDSLNGPCPIHKGSNPTQFRVSLSRNIWNCFSECKHGGNTLDFIAEMEKTSIHAAAVKAIEWFDLDPEAMTAKDAKSAPAENGKPTPFAKPVAQRQAAPVASVAEKSAPNAPLKFRLDRLERSHPYLLEQRGLTPETIVDFGIGFCAKGMMADRIAIPRAVPNRAG
jgi:hypothetical protein